MSDQEKDASQHPMYYTETYHRAKVDKDLYGLTSGLVGGAIGAIGGAVASMPLVNEIKPRDAELSLGQRASFRSAGALVGALGLGYVTAKAGQAVGYIHAITKGPRPQQLNGWTGVVDANRSETSTDKSR